MAEDDNPLRYLRQYLFRWRSFCAVRVSPNEAAKVVIGAHEGWLEGITDWPAYKKLDMSQRSSILFDCVAVYLFCS